MNKLKGIKVQLLLALSLIISTCIMSACKVKEGCPSMNQHVKVGKDGKLPMKPGKSALFPKGMK